MRRFSIVIPAYNEAENIPQVIAAIVPILESADIPFEMLFVDDHSSDGTASVVRLAAAQDARIKYVSNDYPRGYGFAVRKGLDSFSGDMVAVVMADCSDDPNDIVTYYRKMCEGYDCVFGSRFAKTSLVTGYPFHKMLLNRVGNWMICCMFWIPYDDVTNAFKCYSREAVDGMRPFLSCTFNLTVELPLKAIARGYSWAVVPTNWYGRKKGISKWKVVELGSRYVFILLYVWLEQLLSRGDYRKGRNFSGHVHLSKDSE